MKYFIPIIAFLFPLSLVFAQPTLTATVVKVVDGDTLHVIVNGQKESVRLIGVDTPESRRNKKAEKDARRSGEDMEAIIAMGKEAARFTRSLVRKGVTVKIAFDVQQRDRYGRLLGYVYLPTAACSTRRSSRLGMPRP